MLVKQQKTLLNKAFRALNPFEALHIVLTYVYNKLNSSSVFFRYYISCY